MTEYDIDFVTYIIRASVFDIVIPDKVDWFIEDGTFSYYHEVYNVYNNVMIFATYMTTSKNPNDTKHMFLLIPNDYYVLCLKILETIGLTKSI